MNATALVTCPPTHRRRPTGDRGAITPFVVVIALAIFAATGLVVDGSVKLRAARQASAIAEEAARAGAGHIDRDRAYTRGGHFTIDPESAVRAARTYLADTGHTGTVSVAGPRTIRVTVHISKPAVLLPLIGINELNATKTATANLIQGIEGPSR